MFKKVLIPTDGSVLSAQSANKGICFAKKVGAEVVALHVTQPFAATVGFDGMAAAYAITDEDYDKTAAEQAHKYLKADLIFIGSHGRSGLSRLLLGSVTAKVLSLAKTAVLVYRVKEEKDA